MTETAATKRPPAYTASFVQDREGSFWVPVGAAWDHQDGQGFSLTLDLLPNVAGQIVLRRPKAKSKKE